MKDLFIDIETYSATDIKNCGVYKYMEDPEFDVMLIAYAVGHDTPTIVDVANGESTKDFEALFFDEANYRLHAHNATFERLALNKHFKQQVPIDRWHCTMALSARSGLPLGLGDVAKALTLETTKMSVGREMIKYYCTPQTPSKSNGMRTRNRPCHRPNTAAKQWDWGTFKEYCIRDVVVEQEIYFTLHHINPSTPTERSVYILDQLINDTGVGLDRAFIDGAVAVDTEIKELLMSELREMTGLDNPKSDAQLKSWLSYKWGRPIATLSKPQLPALIEKAKDNPTILRALEIRKELGKTSTSKYVKMQDVACKDNRGRGFIQYYGANRTGRFAGRLVQVQNLPQNHLDEGVMDAARQTVREQDTEMMQMQFKSVTDALSQMIRTALIPSEGKIFAVADYAQIEARVIAWIAGEKWRLDTFKRGEDIYISSASMMFGIPRDQISKGSDLRVKGKVAELACIAENQLVLTDTGLVPIQYVTASMKLWDGLQWVNHGGVVYKGLKKIIEYDGLKATEDHLVFIEGQPNQIFFGGASSSSAYLEQTEYRGLPLRICRNNIFGEEMEQELESLLCINQMHRMSECTMAEPQQLTEGQIQRLSELFATKSIAFMVRQETYGSKATLRESKMQGLQELWCEGYSIQIYFSNRCGTVLTIEVPEYRQNTRIRQNRHERTLREGQSEDGRAFYKLCESETKCFIEVSGRGVAVQLQRRNKETGARQNERTDNSGRKPSSCRQTEKLARDCGEVKVYDILNAGRYNRFTVSGKLVHNCGFGGGVGAIKAFAKPKDFLTPEQMQDPRADQLLDEVLQKIIDKWRAASPNIKKLWYNIEQAFTEALNTSEPRRVRIQGNTKHILFRYESGNMTIELPSGRKLFYHKPSLTTNRFGSQSVQYWGMNQTTKQWQEVESYGGKLTENIVQAVARDLICEVMLRVSAEGYPIVIHVHDELIAEVNIETAESDFNRIIDIMAEPISWANGLPTKGAGFLTEYYKKD